jgi:hypothetical protein
MEVPLFGRCGFRFDAEEEKRKQAVLREEQRRAEEAKRRRVARAKERAQEIADHLRRSDNPRKLLTEMGGPEPGARDFDPFLSVETMRAAWARLVSNGGLNHDEEIVTVDGRPNFIGFLQRRGDTKTEWGSWRESARLPAFRAPGAGFEISDPAPASNESPPSWEREFDLLLDGSGWLWKADPIQSKGTFDRMGGSPLTRRIVMDAGEPPRFRRGKNPAGWTIYIANAGAVVGYRQGSAEYSCAIRAALANLARSGEGGIRTHEAG